MASTVLRLAQVTQTAKDSGICSAVFACQTGGLADTNQTIRGRGVSEGQTLDLNVILRTLRVDVPRFDGKEVENWIYKIDKFFTIHQIDPVTRLEVVAFHLDGEPVTWYQWMERGGALTGWDVFLCELRK